MNKTEDILEQPIEKTGVDKNQLASELSQEEVLRMFLAAANYKEDESLYMPITIKRGGKKLLPTFRIRPLSQDEIHTAHVKATQYLPNPAGRRLPKIEGETNDSLERSWTIYFATVDEDRKALWDNPYYQKALQAQHPEVVFSQGNAGAQMIHMLLNAGEKSSLVAKIIEISFPDDVIEEDDQGPDEEEFAKN